MTTVTRGQNLRDVVRDLKFEDKDKTRGPRTRTCKLVLGDKHKDFPRGQQHWVTVKNGLLTYIVSLTFDISKQAILHRILVHSGGIVIIHNGLFAELLLKLNNFCGLFGSRTRTSTCKLVHEDKDFPREPKHCKIQRIRKQYVVQVHDWYGSGDDGIKSPRAISSRLRSGPPALKHRTLYHYVSIHQPSAEISSRGRPKTDFPFSVAK